MEEETENTNKFGEEMMPCVFHWKQEYDYPEAISVEIVLGHSAGVNNDIFEIYTEGMDVKDKSPLMVFPLEKDNHSNPAQFNTELNLPKRTYQFIFRVEDSQNRKSFAVSNDYQQTTLVSGRVVNYLKAKGKVTSRQQAFADINESSRLLGRDYQEISTKKERRCGCGPNRCSVL